MLKAQAKIAAHRGGEAQATDGASNASQGNVDARSGGLDGHSIAPLGAYSGYGLAGTNARRVTVLRINYFLSAASAIVLKGSARSDIL